MAHKAPVPSALVLPPPADAELFWVTCSSVLVPVLAGYFLPPGFCCVHPVHSLRFLSAPTPGAPLLLGIGCFLLIQRGSELSSIPPFLLVLIRTNPFSIFPH